MSEINFSPKAVRRLGDEFAQGATWGVLKTLGLILLGAIVAILIIEWTGLAPRDSTDSPTERSGLKPRTDHGTGCEYLETLDGGITPRLNRDGKQICR